MNRTCFFLLLTGLCLSTFTPVCAQTTTINTTGMNWEDLMTTWESLSIEAKDAAALPYARAALAMALREESETSLDYGSSLDYVGYSLHHTGQYSEAEQYFTAAVEHALKYLGESDESYIGRMSNLAMLHKDMGELAKAASELEVAVHLAEKHLEADNPYTSIMVNNLGLVYENIGNLDRALIYYLRALDLTERTEGRETVRYGVRLLNIAATMRNSGKYAQALDYNLRAMSVLEKSIGKSHPTYLIGLNGLLNSYRMTAQLDKALAVSDSLLGLISALSMSESPEMVNFTGSIAALYYEAGQFNRCAEFTQAALAKYLDLFPTKFSQHNFLARFAMLSYEKLGQPIQALKYALLNNRFSLNELQENFRKFSEDEQRSLYQTYRQKSDNYSLLFAVRHPEFPEMAGAAYDYQLTVKGLTLTNRRQLFQSLRENPDARLSARFKEWQELENDISKQYALPAGKRQPGVDSLIGRSNELERQLVQESEPFRLTSQSVHWQDVSTALSPGEAAIEFGQIKAADSTLYVAWIIRPGDSAPLQVSLFEEKEAGQISAIRKLYTFEHLPEGKNLRELVWTPLEPFLKGISTIYFAPAGILHQINMGGIPVSPTEILADRFQLHRLVSTRQIEALKKLSEGFNPTSALVFGGIRYESDSLALAATNTVPPVINMEELVFESRGQAYGDSWGFLSGSLQEAVEAQNRLKKIGAKVSFADGFKASEGFFKKSVQRSPSPSVLHLATHGFFVTAPDTNARSGFGAAENPMARAGLVLAGGNLVWSGHEPLAGQEDGILTALEISRMDLSGTELAILSACGTGQGKVEAGEGILGLQRAFKMAGVQYIIMTLWNVQDQDARQFMDLFYEEWLSRKKSVPEAFRLAQQKMRADHARPFQPQAWAGFILLE